MPIQILLVDDHAILREGVGRLLDAQADMRVLGSSIAATAEQLGVSPKSIETYRHRLMTKLGIENLPALVKFAIRHGITTLERARQTGAAAARRARAVSVPCAPSDILQAIPNIECKLSWDTRQCLLTSQ